MIYCIYSNKHPGGCCNLGSKLTFFRKKCGQIYQYLIVLKPFWLSNPLNMEGAVVGEGAFIRINMVIASAVDKITLKLLMMVKLNM